MKRMADRSNSLSPKRSPLRLERAASASASLSPMRLLRRMSSLKRKEKPCEEWSEEEDKALREGVKAYGVGQWVQILKADGSKGRLLTRKRIEDLSRRMQELAVLDRAHTLAVCGRRATRPLPPQTPPILPYQTELSRDGALRMLHCPADLLRALTPQHTTAAAARQQLRQQLSQDRRVRNHPYRLHATRVRHVILPGDRVVRPRVDIPGEMAGWVDGDVEADGVGMEAAVS